MSRSADALRRELLAPAAEDERVRALLQADGAAHGGYHRSMLRRVGWRTLVVLLSIGAAAAAESWPARGDSVHIAASFKGLNAPSGVPMVRTVYDMPACVKLRVAKAKPKKQRWTIEDSMGGELELQGAWAPRMHRGKMECEAQLAAEGEPALKRSGDTFILAQGAPK